MKHALLVLLAACGASEQQAPVPPAPVQTAARLP
jgi:hypothetical protein